MDPSSNPTAGEIFFGDCNAIVPLSLNPYANGRTTEHQVYTVIDYADGRMVEVEVGSDCNSMCLSRST